MLMVMVSRRMLPLRGVLSSRLSAVARSSVCIGWPRSTGSSRVWVIGVASWLAASVAGHAIAPARTARRRDRRHLAAVGGAQRLRADAGWQWRVVGHLAAPMRLRQQYAGGWIVLA